MKTQLRNIARTRAAAADSPHVSDSAAARSLRRVLSRDALSRCNPGRQGLPLGTLSSAQRGAKKAACRAGTQARRSAGFDSQALLSFPSAVGWQDYGRPLFNPCSRAQPEIGAHHPSAPAARWGFKHDRPWTDGNHRGRRTRDGRSGRLAQAQGGSECSCSPGKSISRS